MSLGPQTVSEPTWFKSSYSGGNATECVECARVAHGALIRDSKHRSGPVLSIRAQAWRCFVDTLGQADSQVH